MDFTTLKTYYRQARLGYLYCPNGESIIPNGPACESAIHERFRVSLHDLCALLWPFSLGDLDDGLSAIIVFGSAVREPKTIEYKSLILRRPKRRVEIIQPRDIDVVFVDDNMVGERESFQLPDLEHTYDCGIWVVRGGIHARRVSGQTLMSDNANLDSVVKSIHEHGVPIIGNIETGSRRCVQWYETRRGDLSCCIT